MTYKSLIDKYEIISFDIFDTLIKRYVKKPRDIFYLVENIYDKEKKVKSDFAIKRIKAEKKARRRYNYVEVNLDEIYLELLDVFDKSELELLKKLEIATELDLCFANKEMYEVYQYAKEKGKIIYIISDMYLSKDIINKILIKNGYKGYKKIFLSNENHITKTEGTLFKFFLEEENIKAKDILHIGDNKYADIKMGKKMGLNVLHYRETLKELPYLDINLKENKILYLMNRFIKYNINNDKNDYYKIGYSVFGPLLYGYSKWLIDSVKLYDIKKILFLSRDGYVLKKCFELFNVDNISADYVYVSRKSIIGASLYDISNLTETFNKYKAWPKYFDLKYFLNRVGYKGNLYIDEILLEKKMTKEEFLSNDKIKKIFYEIKNDIQKSSKEQKKYLKEYLSQFNNYDRLAIVDIGGNQTIQINLQSFFNKNNINIELISFNLLLKREEEKNSLAYLYSKNKNKEIYIKTVFFYYFLELLLTAPHGSVEAYKQEKEKIYPIFGIYDYENNGNFLEEKYIIEEFQKGAIDFILDFKNLGNKYISITPHIAINNLINLGIKPLINDAKKLGNVKFNADGLEKLADPKSIKYYIKHPKYLWKDYQCSMWKGGFLTLLLQTNRYNNLLVSLYNVLK